MNVERWKRNYERQLKVNNEVKHTPEHLTRRFKKGQPPIERNRFVPKKRLKLPKITDNNLLEPVEKNKKFSDQIDLDAVIMNDKITERQKTIILIGLGRSGTSITGAVLDSIGVCMDGSKDGHFERMIFKNGIVTHWKEVQQEIIKLNNSFTIWGFQLLHNPRHLKKILKYIRNPHVIFVFRDPVAIAQRSFKSNDYRGHSINHIIDDIIKEMLTLWSLHKICKCPYMYISNERMRYTPEIVIDHISEFLNIVVTDKQKGKALKRISPKGGYLLQ